MTGQEARDEAEIIGIPCANTERHAAQNWQMSATGYCRCLGVDAEREARDDEREALIAEANRVCAPGIDRTGVGYEVGLIRRLADALARKHPEPEITDAEALRLGKVAWVAYQGDTDWAQGVVEDCFSPADDLPEEALDMITVARAVVTALRAPVGEGEQ